MPQKGIRLCAALVPCPSVPRAHFFCSQSLETQNQALSRRCANLEDEVQTLRLGLAEVRQHILLEQQPQQQQHHQQRPQPTHARQEPIQKAPSRSSKVCVSAKSKAF